MAKDATAAEIDRNQSAEADTSAEAAEIVVNDGKAATVTVDGVTYRRFGIRTHVLTGGDDILEVAGRYVAPHCGKDDIVFISEKALGCTQGRAIRLSDIEPRPLARMLSDHVMKTPAGIGLGMPETMEMALRECGTPRILLAAAVGAIGKLLGRRGWFYRIAGERASSIDGPCSYTLPPYNEYVSLSPLEPSESCKRLSEVLGGAAVAVVDLNDLGGNILGSHGLTIDESTLLKVLKDNPLGQESQRTPFGVVRVISAGEACS